MLCTYKGIIRREDLEDSLSQTVIEPTKKSARFRLKRICKYLTEQTGVLHILHDIKESSVES